MPEEVVKQVEPTFSPSQLRVNCPELFGVETHVFDGAITLAGFTEVGEITKSAMQDAIFQFLNYVPK